MTIVQKSRDEYFSARESHANETGMISCLAAGTFATLYGHNLCRVEFTGQNLQERFKQHESRRGLIEISGRWGAANAAYCNELFTLQFPREIPAARVQHSTCRQSDVLRSSTSRQEFLKRGGGRTCVVRATERQTDAWTLRVAKF